ncbi:hypothetical protein Ga0102493_111202 [Erythrobacter litoralis]|uniref:Sel1 repeat family protein n=1 Tax=Erythrobacter litoralis TaxID=39960 RepID=A0A074M8B0_9SPHN|nr:hypothetical protein [Erythrobacter litoralis]AOL22229.1 hypothetical protein Ga0102493_111202 [Erythrobacter litoralis]KEO91021.1 hypothetical protein EH32_01465 [Erythrobacter litoralis]
MQLTSMKGADCQPAETGDHDLALAERLAAASQGDIAALFDLGVAYSTASSGAQSDMVEAHKWFNLAAARGHEEAAWSRADISEEMTAREIAEAQRRARQWLAQERARAA